MRARARRTATLAYERTPASPVRLRGFGTRDSVRECVRDGRPRCAVRRGDLRGKLLLHADPVPARARYTRVIRAWRAYGAACGDTCPARVGARRHVAAAGGRRCNEAPRPRAALLCAAAGRTHHCSKSCWSLTRLFSSSCVRKRKRACARARARAATARAQRRPRNSARTHHVQVLDLLLQLAELIEVDAVPATAIGTVNTYAVNIGSARRVVSSALYAL